MKCRLSLAAFVAALLLAAAPGAQAEPVDFTFPSYVDMQLGGGEPLVYADPIHHTIVYSSHEGTTHFYRNGAVAQTSLTFFASYRNQVNTWWSKDGGRSWTHVNEVGGFAQSPAENNGFSDPDLSQDEGGRIYNTGINLATNALFSSADGGVTWDRGTAQCQPGDRPWVIGGKKDEVFFVTNTIQDTIQMRMFTSTDGGRTCSQSGIPVFGNGWVGNGKPYYDRAAQRIVVPVDFGSSGLGVATWKRGDAAFTATKAVDVSKYAHWASIALDDAGGLYLTYDNDLRARGTSGGCDGSATPLANTIGLVYSPDYGKTWRKPVIIAQPTGKRVLWPWIVAGDKGKVNVVYYETNKIADLACEKADLFVKSATILDANTSTPKIITVDAVGRTVAPNADLCQNGTTCVATGEDRRLGDFFTNGIDESGCVMIATGDTNSMDPVSGGPRPISLPLFTRQISGPALRGGGDCSGRETNLGLPGVGTTNVTTTGSAAPTTTSVSGSARGGPQAPCFSRRRFPIRLRAPKGDRLVRATIFVNGKKRRTLRGKSLRRARVDLLALPKGTFTLKIEARTAKGKKLKQTRRYRTCVPRKRLPAGS